MNRNKAVRQILNYVAKRKYGTPYKSLNGVKQLKVRKSAGSLFRKK